MATSRLDAFILAGGFPQGLFGQSKSLQVGAGQALPNQLILLSLKRLSRLPLPPPPSLLPYPLCSCLCLGTARCRVTGPLLTSRFHLHRIHGFCRLAGWGARVALHCPDKIQKPTTPGCHSWLWLTPFRRRTSQEVKRSVGSDISLPFIRTKRQQRSSE